MFRRSRRSRFGSSNLASKSFLCIWNMAIERQTSRTSSPLYNNIGVAIHNFALCALTAGILSRLLWMLMVSWSIPELLNTRRGTTFRTVGMLTTSRSMCNVEAYNGLSSGKVAHGIRPPRNLRSAAHGTAAGALPMSTQYEQWQDHLLSLSRLRQSIQLETKQPTIMDVILDLKSIPEYGGDRSVEVVEQWQGSTTVDQESLDANWGNRAVVWDGTQLPADATSWIPISAERSTVSWGCALDSDPSQNPNGSL
jgi:hypothetical protein